jgi:UDPglucose 6-dehydrogenase
MKICMIGSGYVGLVTGACFAEMGNDVICIDDKAEKVNMLKNGIVPIYEPGLKEILDRNVTGGRIVFSTNLEEGVSSCQICFIAVGTPQDVDGSADLKYVLQVARQIGSLMTGYKIIVDKSTVPVGTADKVRTAIQKELDRRGLGEVEFDVVSNPEFLKEGNALQDFMRPERVVVGTDNVRTAALFKELYDPFVRTTNNPVLIMDIKSAELTKYASNAFLATKVSFINELAILCDKVGADITQVREGMGTDSRIGPRFLLAGPGYGGSCFPKDVQALIHTARSLGHSLEICQAAHRANQRQMGYFAHKIISYYEGLNADLSRIKIAVWGLTFKPKTDDIREAPALAIIDALLKKGMTVHVFDPIGMDNARKVLGDSVCYARDGRDNYSILEGADGLAIITEWNMFKSPDLEKMKSLMKAPVVFDGRNILHPQEMKSHGFTYSGIGR